MGWKLRTANMLAGILFAIIMFFGDCMPVVFGIAMTFVDGFMYLINSLDFGSPSSGYFYVGLPTAILGIIILPFLLLIVICSIAVFFTSRTPLFKISLGLNIANCISSLISVALSIFSAFMLALVFMNEPEYMFLFIAWPLAGLLLLAAMIVLGIFLVRKMKEELNFKELLESMKNN